MATDPLYTLKRERNDIKKAYEKAFNKRDSEVKEGVVWGVVGGLALAADWAIFGGIGTIIAVASGANAIRMGRRAKYYKKQLVALDERIQKIEDVYVREQAQAKAQLDVQKELNKEFSPVAQKEVDALRKQMATMKEELEAVKKENDAKQQKIDKPKYDKPDLRRKRDGQGNKGPANS